MKKLLGLSLLSLLAGACDGGSSEFEDTAVTVEGIYSVTTFTHNDAACSPGGTSQLGDDKFAIAAMQTYFGQRVLTVTSCASAADCREKLADMRAGESWSFEFDFGVSQVNEEGIMTGAGASTGFGIEGTCRGGEVTSTKLELLGSRLRIEQSITIADDYPAEDGFCSTELARKHAAGNACSEMEVLTAELLEVL